MLRMHTKLVFFSLGLHPEPHWGAHDFPPDLLISWGGCEEGTKSTLAPPTSTPGCCDQIFWGSLAAVVERWW